MYDELKNRTVNLKIKATCTTFTDFILCNGLHYVFYVVKATLKLIV